MTKAVVPETYSELIDHYWGFVTTMLRRAGVPSEEVEDYGQEYFLRFYSKDRLSAYDPNYRGNPTKFTTFLGTDVKLFLLQQSRGIMKRKMESAAETDDFIIQVLSGQTVVCETEYRETVSAIRQFLARAGLVINRPTVKVSYVEAFDLCVVSYEKFGRVDRKALAEWLDVSDTTIGKMVRKVRAMVAEHQTDLQLT
jgi:hypothetical protein